MPKLMTKILAKNNLTFDRSKQILTENDWRISKSEKTKVEYKGHSYTISFFEKHHRLECKKIAATVILTFITLGFALCFEGFRNDWQRILTGKGIVALYKKEYTTNILAERWCVEIRDGFSYYLGIRSGLPSAEDVQDFLAALKEKTPKVTIQHG